MSDNIQETAMINKDDILTTPARQILFDSLMSGLNLKQSSKKAGISEDYASNLYTGKIKRLAGKCGIKELVRQEQGKIARRTAKRLEITIEGQLRKYELLGKVAKRKGDFSAARACWDSQSKIIGAFEADNSQRATKFVMILGKPDI